MYNMINNLDLDLQHICRICLLQANDIIDLFGESDESLEIRKKISLCFRIILNSEKYLPCAICNHCIQELNNANNFRIKCVTINERLKEYYENLTKNPTTGLVAETVPEYAVTENSPSNLANDAIESDNNDDIPINENDKQSYKCHICNKIMKSTKSLERHITLMHEKRRHIGRVMGYGSARRYHCTTCSYSTPHSQTLVNHMRRHNGDRPFQCECGKNFTQASSLAAHRKSHSTMAYFTCSECGKQFKHAFSLKTHLRVHDKGHFSCTVCMKLLKSKETLHAHMKRHYKIYNYNCEDCGDTFVTSAELHNHRLKHNSVKNIFCHICEYATNTRKTLLAHIKRHVGDKPFKCNFCDKAFYTQGDLKRHMRVHTREKPFSCQTCSQKFSYSTSLNKHMLNVHGVQYKWGDIKWKETRMKKPSVKPASGI